MVREKGHVDEVEEKVGKDRALDLTGDQIDASVEKARKKRDTEHRADDGCAPADQRHARGALASCVVEDRFACHTLLSADRRLAIGRPGPDIPCDKLRDHGAGLTRPRGLSF